MTIKTSVCMMYCGSIISHCSYLLIINLSMLYKEYQNKDICLYDVFGIVI